MDNNGLIKGLITLFILFCFNLTTFTGGHPLAVAFSQQYPEHQIYNCKHRKQAGLTKEWHGLEPCHTYSSQASNSRSDTIDILNYTINLDITDFTSQIIKGNCEITFTAKMNNINTLSLDLLQMNIDSIISNNVSLPYFYDDTLIIASLPATLNTGDTSGITIYYNGQPQGDPSGWGGFYFMGNYAFNLGVGFDANPHNYGRVWFPCFDNFVERSTYEFNIITSGGRRSVCNGELISEVTLLGDTIMRTWQMNYEIPTYLTCVAVADYVVVNQVHNGISGVIPIQLFASPGDTTALKNSFVNLSGAIDAFENSYGAYQWNKVGFSLVPFSSGAMEHATNIAYPRDAADGTTGWEDLMVHELSHQWWGNLVTCETAEDMWINEGMAVYSEFLFWENVYDKATYSQAVRDNHEYVLHLAHIYENGYRAISGIPHEYTYGDHVYYKGADVAHTLRGYIGDSLFFNGLTTFLANNQFTHINSYDLRDQLTAITGVDLTDFFDKWVFNPGFPHFSIDSSQIIQNGVNYDVTVHVKQKLTGAPAYYNNVPLEITFIDAGWNEQTEKIIVPGAISSFTFTLPSSPVFTALNMEGKISDAISSEVKVFNSTGSYTFANAHMNINVSAITDSAFIRIEHNWTAPDPIAKPTIYKLSPNRYWKIDGILPSSFSATATILYEGRTIGINTYYDHELFSDTTATEDSLVLLYRGNTAENWCEYEYYTKTIITPNDKWGQIVIDSLVLGEYVFAMKGDTIYSVIPETSEVSKTLERYSLYPNPASDNFIVKTTNANGFESGTVLKVTDISGKTIYQKRLEKNNSQLSVKTKGWEDGIYLVSINDSRRILFQDKIVVMRY